MMYLKKNKKAIEAAGFGIIIGIIVLLLSAGIIIWVIKNSAGKADEKLQVDLCRISNEIKLGVDEKKPWYVPGSSPRVCNTIDRYTKKELQIPTKSYEQTEEGAREEIRDMIKNCWYMWLEGSQPNMFNKFPGDEECFVCYLFKIENEFRDWVSLDSIADSMNKPYFAKDASDKCATVGGFYEQPTDCGNPADWVEEESKKAASESKKCFVKEGGIMNECENKGGCCFETATEGYIEKYTKWSCPEGECYIKKDNIYSYTRYITEYTPRGGDVYFVYPGQGAAVSDSIGGETYAISFISPGEECGLGCNIIKALGWVTSPVGMVSLFLLGATGFGEPIVSTFEAILPGVDKPSLILVSTHDHAEDLRCIIE